MSASTAQVGLNNYRLPGLNSPRVSFHPTYSGGGARSNLIFDSVVGTIEGLLIMYYAEPCIRFLAAPSTLVSPLSVSTMQMFGCLITSIHVGLSLGIPNRRTNVESRTITQLQFEILDIIGAATFGWLAWKGEAATGLRSNRMWMLTGAVSFFGAVRYVTALSKEGWAGAYIEEGEDAKDL